ncbi:hypothetical protein V2H45_04315 [Tumidithrix elongata RA019]|uniref:DUF1761 domain-containing protein n=1 Tax=Tumidithrix elongata BACA0141 TaxID=2716417 RepID=A0AAW9PVX3_9CYAN|nr:hypothetical protein [Tumidithrix elongata RA019]
MQLLFDAIACGVLAALTWAGLVWMSPAQPIQQRLGWLQGIGSVAIANLALWLILVGIGSKLIPVWVIVLFGFNALIGKLVFPYFGNIQIPTLWSVVIHPAAIALIVVLLGGALGAF